ncbi:hypothetical protein EYZ11_004264 [Aspergillus tanneri]|uniref:Hemerythrin-like domain-containing protein n=1 Tax=Aspergillus tanneri TaxID=1220188 RepID=A0A4S3JRW3_9EURO|nr:uncharacterized protein ATNIH1004_010914 [Aspergillus tanneri]KAA8641975.1 hypothetical protein ATNIH1004_010914 [Aspergillus tanneri]THC96271.1 hypothetical protein EYZ11_004264 [Aspergillus tanneri]
MTPRISDTIKEDHREIEATYDRIITSYDRDEQIRFQNLFTWELARHFVGEELIIYPAFEKHIPDGASIADKNRKVHQRVKEQLKTFQTMDPTNPRYIPTIKTLMENLAPHIREEEDSQLGALENALSSHDSEHMSKSFNRTKIFVPSRAHPGAPSKPPFETVVGLLTAPVDQLADLFRKWPHSKGMET